MKRLRPPTADQGAWIAARPGLAAALLDLHGLIGAGWPGDTGAELMLLPDEPAYLVCVLTTGAPRELAERWLTALCDGWAARCPVWAGAVEFTLVYPDP